MKYDIYFHNDFDGHASAAVVLAFLEGRGDVVEHLVRVDFDLQAEWRDPNFFKKHKLFKGPRNPAIVVDFPYHPGAAWWFDHHMDPFKNPLWKKEFKPSETKLYKPEFLSCCHLVYSSLKKNFKWKSPKHLEELVKWLDVIDGARYDSPKQTLLLKEPALQVDTFIDKTKNEPALGEWIVRLLAKEPLAAIARIPKVKKVADEVREENKTALVFYKKNLEVIGDTTFINLTKYRGAILRYASFFLYPKIRYAVRFGWKGKLYHVGVGAHPWLKKKNTLHIGMLLREYGGGGHKDAGAVDFASREDALRAIPEIISKLNRKK